MDEVRLSKEATAARLGISLSGLNRLINNGTIKVVKVGNKVSVPVSEVERLLEVRSHD